MSISKIWSDSMDSVAWFVCGCSSSSHSADVQVVGAHDVSVIMTVTCNNILDQVQADTGYSSEAYTQIQIAALLLDICELS